VNCLFCKNGVAVKYSNATKGMVDGVCDWCHGKGYVSREAYEIQKAEKESTPNEGA